MSIFLNKTDVQKIMEEKKENWTLSSEYRDAEGNTSCWIFFRIPSEEDKKLRFPIPAYSCEIRPNGEFRFVYAPINSIVQMMTPFCSPITNLDHFLRIQALFERDASIINKYKK